MNKTLLTTIVVIIVIVVVVILALQLTNLPSSATPNVNAPSAVNSNGSQATSNNQPAQNQPAGSVSTQGTVPAATIVPPSAQVSGVADKVAGQIADLMKSWFSTNKSYAGFMANSNNLRQVRVIFGTNKTSMDFYIDSTATHYIVRTHVPGDLVQYCMDQSSSSALSQKYVDDTQFRVKTDCKGAAL